jgi:MYXO-CTERM domain-containing protein
MTTQIRRVCALVRASAALAAVVVASSGALAVDRVSVAKNSNYRDGVWTGAGSNVFSFTFDPMTPPNTGTFPPGNANELRPALTQAMVRAQYGAGTLGLLGYTNAGAPVQYGGAANVLVDHTANFGWNSNFSAECINGRVRITVAANFDWTNSGLTTAAQQNAKFASFKSNVEGWWSDRYGIQTTMGTVPIDFVLTNTAYTMGAAYDQNVTVLAGNSRANLTTWYADAPAVVEAHEFGHMIGAWDEYWSGAIDPVNLTTDYTSLMGVANQTVSGTGLRARYFNDVLNWFQGSAWNVPGASSIIAIPTPGGVALLVLGGVVLSRRRRTAA